MHALRNLVKGKTSEPQQSPLKKSSSDTQPPQASPLKLSGGIKNPETPKNDGLKLSTNSLSLSQGDDEAPKIELKDDQVQGNDRKKLFSKLTGLMGKDIVSLLSLPVSLFEPTSVLQTMVEPLRHSELLFKISATEDPIDRISLVAAFCVALFSYYVRTLKPFNPVLGETFEFIPPSKSYKSLCEQVSHHPPIGVAHSTCDDWTLTQESHISTRFWGTSVDVQSLGDNHLHTHKCADHYTWKSPNACIHNILFGKIFVEYHGAIPIKSMKGGETANVNFKKGGWFGGLNHEVSGEVHDKDGNLKAVLHGRWNEYLSVTKVDENGNKGTPVELWRKPQNEGETAHKWKWDPFVDQLTELTESMEQILPPTDSRLRGDLRALSALNMKLAGREKVALEERERRKRREREAQGKKWAPVHFKKVQDENFEAGRWEYVGNYWEERSQRLQQQKEKQKLAEEKKAETTKGFLDDVSDPKPDISA